MIKKNAEKRRSFCRAEVTEIEFHNQKSTKVCLERVQSRQKHLNLEKK